MALYYEYKEIKIIVTFLPHTQNIYMILIIHFLNCLHLKPYPYLTFLNVESISCLAKF